MLYCCDLLGRVWHSPIIRLYLLAFFIAPVFLHPQCLDFKPPFKPKDDLQFCAMYRNFGCCDSAKDKELMAKFYKIMDNFDYYGYASCAGYVQDLLCQVSKARVRSLLGCFQNYIIHLFLASPGMFVEAYSCYTAALIRNKMV